MGRVHRTAGLLLLLVIGGAIAPASALATNGMYIALGDSVASGEGNGSYVSPTLCHRSNYSHPFLLAFTPQLTQTDQFHSYACTGATIGDVVDQSQVVTDPITNATITQPPQLAQIPTGVPIQAVTVTAGIDDPVEPGTGWVQMLENCLLQGYVFCTNYNGAVQDLITSIHDQYVNQLLPALHGLDGDPRIYVTGYYDPFPTSKPPLTDAIYCPDTYPTLVGDYQDGTLNLIERWETQLNGAIKQAALAGGATFVGLVQAIPASHRICTAHSWVYTPTLFGAQNGLASYFHPTRPGQKSIASTISKALLGLPASWDHPQRLGGGITSSTDPHRGMIGTDAAGDLTAAWAGYTQQDGFIGVADDWPANMTTWQPFATLVHGNSSSVTDMSMWETPSGAAVVGSGSGSRAFVRTSSTAPFTDTGSIPLTSSPDQYFHWLVDSNGIATAVWAAGGPNGTWYIETATHPTGGSWSQPTILAQTTTNVGTVVEEDPAGDAVVGWIKTSSDGSASLMVRLRSPAGVWAAAQRVSPLNPTAGITSIDLSMDGNGNLMAAWAAIPLPVSATSPSVLQTRYRAAATGTWTAVRTVAFAHPAGDTYGVSVALSQSGKAVVGWLDQQPGSHQVLAYASQSSGGGGWSYPDLLATPPGGGSSAGEPNITIDSHGNEAAVWQLADGQVSNVPTYVVGMTRPVGGHWTLPQTISSLLDSNNCPSWAGYPSQPLIDPTGKVTVIWSADENSDPTNNCYPDWSTAWTYTASADAFTSP